MYLIQLMNTQTIIMFDGIHLYIRTSTLLSMNYLDTHTKKNNSEIVIRLNLQEACLTIYMHVHITVTVPQHVCSHCLFRCNSRKDYFIQ